MSRLLRLLVAPLLLGGLATAQVDCQQGCTPGYWKTHPESWDGIAPDFTNTIFAGMSFNATLGVTPADSGLADTVTLIDAAWLTGGGLNALARHTAAGLASADALACYSYSVSEVVALYRDAVGVDAGPEDVESAKNLFDTANNLGTCPLPEQVTRFCFAEEASCPCGNVAPASGCVNSTGVGAQLEVVAGTTSVVADDLVLLAHDLPVGEFAIFIAAQGHQSMPFADGRLCVGGPGYKTVRYTAPTLVPATGALRLGPGLVALSNSNHVGLPAIVGIDAGESWFFQTYYRDAAGPCGTGANLSNAVALTFH